MKRLVVALMGFLLPLGAQAGENVTYSSGGADYEGYMAKAPGASKGLVLVIHDWDGLTDYEVKRADMLAGMGYDAFAVDLFGKGNRPPDVAGRRAATGALYKDREKMRRLLLAGLSEARKMSSGKTVVMGYCFGGAATLEMARSGKADGIAGYATFHGGLKTPEGQSYPASTPPLLIAHGGADTSVTMEHVAGLSQELETAKIPYEIQVYSGAPHAFTVFGSNRYREVADMQSWNAFKDFLAKNLGG
jgi:dienelactone hydrolase